MTIAVCYVTPEGVVFGADSTSTYSGGGALHYYNHAQKIFEIGEDSTLALVTWGLGGLAFTSYRFLAAKMADGLRKKPPSSVEDAAVRWIDEFWTAYDSKDLKPLLDHCRSLHKKTAHNPAATQSLQSRTEKEEQEYNQLKAGLVVGFCLGGYVLPTRTPCAYQIIFDPLGSKPKPTPVPVQQPMCYGAPNIIQRMILGIDDVIKNQILQSGKWSGTAGDLDAILGKHALSHPVLPMRDAIDFVHTCVHSTIKALKFSNHSQICGGPIELAVITADREFRWVRHKPWDSAITDGDV